VAATASEWRVDAQKGATEERMRGGLGVMYGKSEQQQEKRQREETSYQRKRGPGTREPSRWRKGSSRRRDSRRRGSGRQDAVVAHPVSRSQVVRLWHQA
jgi:hypothetical protein